jgi:hypothetical protein
VGLRAVGLDVFETTGSQHRHVSTQPFADGCIGGPTACVSNSSAHNTRVDTGRRPRGEGLGKRLATLCSLASTISAQRNVSAHGRMELV